MGRHNLPSEGGTFNEPTRRRRAVGGRRGVSLGVIAALVTVVVLVGGIILWRFFGDSLSRRSSDAAGECLQGTATVAVVADPSIAGHLASFADSFDAEASPVGDKCIDVVVQPVDSDSVLKGLTGSWPSDLGERPALWVPASSVQTARLQAAAGEQMVSDSRSLVTSPVVLAVRPDLKKALGEEGWPALPGLQNDPSALDSRDLAGWGPLRLALPRVGSADAAFLATEAVAATSAPPNSPPTAGIPAASELLAGQPRLPADTVDAAWAALTGPGLPAAGAVHAVAMTEQQLFTRSAEMPNAADAVAEWMPSGPAAVADYPTVLLAGPWLSQEQVAGASEFARFLRKKDQLAALAEAGFRAEGVSPEGNDVVGFPTMAAALPAADDGLRAAVAGLVSPSPGGTTTVVLNEGLTGVEGGKARLYNVTSALRDRINALPPNAAVGLWTFNKIDSAPAVSTGPLSEPVGPGPRSAAITGVLDNTTPTSGGGLSFTTLREAYRAAVAGHQPGQQNSVLIITQGPHTDLSLDGPGLLDALKGLQDPARPVAVNVIDFGGDPDRPTWEAVAKLSGGRYLEVPRSDSPDLAGAIAQGLS